MELQEYLEILKKRIALIILVTLLTTITSAVLSYFVITPMYKAEISVVIGRNDLSKSSSNQNYQDVMMYQQMVKTYSVLAKSKKVAEDVKSKLNLNISAEAIISMISTTPQGTTEFLTISVKSKKPKEAMDIVNTLAKSLKEVSSTVYGVDNVKIVDAADLPTVPDSPKPNLNIAIAFFLGIFISVGIAFLLEYMDNTVKTPEDIEKLLGITVIGSIPHVDEGGKS